MIQTNKWPSTAEEIYHSNEVDKAFDQARKKYTECNDIGHVDHEAAIHHILDVAHNHYNNIDDNTHDQLSEMISAGLA